MYEEWFTEEIEKLVDHAYSRVKKMKVLYRMNAQDMSCFEKESPKHMKRIREIEQLITAPMSFMEVEDLCDKWVRNWKYVFERRKIHKRVEHEKRGEKNEC